MKWVFKNPSPSVRAVVVEEEEKEMGRKNVKIREVGKWFWSEAFLYGLLVGIIAIN